MAEDKTWAKGYIFDPLTALDPSDETGPGSHFRSTFSQQPSTPIPPTPNTSNPFRRKPVHPPVKDGAASNPIRPVYPTSPGSARPHTSDFRKEAFTAYVDGPPRRSNTVGSNVKRGDFAARHRSISLGERFPGDDSNHPLDILRRESKRAYRSPHLKKKHLPGADLIDRLDVGPGDRYHHEGPYDAALIARNSSWETSPLAAVSDTTEEALKATPHESVLDAVERHRPLDGTAIIPPGEQDRFGRTYNYKEGTNMMIEHGGNYKRWPGIKYHPDDIKGKGEPSYSIEKALKEHKMYGDKGKSDGIELQDRRVTTVGPNGYAEVPTAQNEAVASSGITRSGSNKRSSFGGLKKRIGSLRRRRG